MKCWVRYSPLLLLLTTLVVSLMAVQWGLLLLIIGALIWSNRNTYWTPRMYGGFLLILFFILLGVAPLLLVRLTPELQESGEVLFSATPQWGITSDSLHAFSLVGIRCLNAALALMLFTTLTPIYQLLIELRELGLPRILVDLVEMTYRFINLLFDTSHEITEAQKSRLGYLQPRTSLNHFSMMLSRTLVLSMHDSDVMYDAMLSRGAEEAWEETKEGEEPLPTRESPHGAEVLRLEEVTFRYKETNKTVLEQVNFSVQRGEKIALMGANGAGKSTLMKLLSGLLQPSSGKIFLEGKEVTKQAKAIRRQVGILFQNADLQLFTPTVWEEIAFGLRNRGMKGEELEQKVDEVLQQFGLKELAQHPPHLLSGGQKKWVTIAAVDALSPSVILLDEPNMGLDGWARQELQKILERWSQEGKTLIISCHNADFAQSWSDRVLLIEQHRLARDESPRSFFADRAMLHRTHIAPALHHLTVTQPSTTERTAETHLPLFLSTSKARALIIGGGKGAYRKALTMRKMGLTFDLISPHVIPELEALLSSSESGYYFQRSYQQGDFQGYTLAILATGDLEEELKMIEECEQERVHYNCLTDPSRSSFQMGATHLSEGIELGVHTMWRLPEVTQWIRDEVAEKVLQQLDANKLQRLSELRLQMNQARREDSNLYPSLKNEYDRLLGEICIGIRKRKE